MNISKMRYLYIDFCIYENYNYINFYMKVKFNVLHLCINTRITVNFT